MLYVCPTPIGNLEDITLRVLKILQEVDLILAEDTRHTGQLLRHFKIEARLQSLHEHNEKEKAAGILQMLEQGKTIALVSDAGMPGISDPGSWLIKEVIEAGLPLEVLPGANAALVGYLQSGFLSPHFLYYGFLPRKKTERKRILENMRALEFPIIFYEAPHRLKEMLIAVEKVFGDRYVSISRELTKRFEETKRGLLSELIAHYSEQDPRGEFVIVISGLEPDSSPKILEADIYLILKELIRGGSSRKSAVDQVATEYGLSKNQVYRIALQVKLED